MGKEDSLFIAKKSRTFRKRIHSDTDQNGGDTSTSEAAASEPPTQIAKISRTNIREKKNPLIASSETFREKKKTFSYESSRTAMPHGSTDQLATAHNEIETTAKIKGGSKIRAGPVKPPLNVRLTCRFDYQPDICKDYKETGYCGYGDNCKFMHDRGDYKTGWQLEEEWEEARKAVKKEEENLEVAKVEDDLPLSCGICHEEFKNPVVTKCGHFFCEMCAIERDKKFKTCFFCEEKTNGIFNTAHKLLHKVRT